MIPLSGVDARGLRRYQRALSNQLFRWFLVQAKRELEAGADEVLEYAKVHASEFFDRPTSTTGLLAQGIAREATAKIRAGNMYIGLGWLRRYGRVLEHGPRITEWIIRAKWRKALRWMTGEFSVIGGSSRSGGQTLGEGIAYARWVRHRWARNQLRPHLVPSAEAITPQLSRRILKAFERAHARMPSGSS